MRVVRFFLTSVLCLLFVPVVKGGQSPYDLLRGAQRYADLYNWRAALPLFEKAEPLLRKNGDERNALYAHIGALRLAPTAPITARSEELAHLLSSSSLLVRDRRLRLFAFAVKGDLDGETDQESARQDWMEVTKLATELGEAKWVYRAEGQLGFADYYDGDVASCRRRVAAALIAATEAHDVGAEIFFLSTIANGYEMQHMLLPVAIDYAKKAINLAAAFPDTGPPMIARATLIRALADSGRPAEAQGMVQVLLSAPNLDYAEKVNYFVSAGDVAIALRDIPRAVAFFEDAIRIALACDDEREAADVESSVSNLYLETGDLVRAEQSATKAVAKLRELGVASLLPAKLDSLGQVLIAERKYSSAKDVYDRAEAIQDSLIGKADSLFTKAALITGADQLYAHHVALLAEHFNNPEACYQVVEQARGRAMADLLLSRPGVTPEAKTTEERISSLQLRMAAAESPVEMRNLRDAIFLEEQSRALNPDLTILSTAHFRPVSISELRRALKPSEALLEYVVAEPTSYILVITKNGCRIVKVCGRNNLETLVTAYVKAVKDQSKAMREARALYRALLAPIGISHWSTYLIIPDGCLNMLPFDALVDDHGQFVVQSHVVAYEPSATTLYLLRKAKDSSKSSKRMLAVGGVSYGKTHSMADLSERSYGRDMTFADLPNSAREADVAAGAFENSQTTKLEGAAATEYNLKRALESGYDYVHLAVHAISSDDPDRSALVVMSDPARGEDGFVQASEIVQMRLRTTLVVLSGCDTNVGPIEGEEGISALSTAFILAGAKTVVSTVWPVEDRSSLALMTAFYRHLGAGESVSDAMSAAKRDVLSKFGPNSPPLYWGGFVVQGS